MKRVEHVNHALRFDRVSHAGRSAMALNHRGRSGRYAGIFPGALDAEFLTDGVGRSDAFSFAVARSAEAAHYCVNLVAITLGISQALEQKDGGAFAHDEAVSSLGIGAGAGR